MADCLQEKTLQRLCGARSSASRISFSARIWSTRRAGEFVLLGKAIQ